MLLQCVQLLRVHAGQEAHLQTDQHIGNALYGFARVDEVGALHRACCAVNAVAQCGFILVAYLLARFLLCVDDGGCRFYQLVGQLCGRRTESNLIGHLIESADRLRAFAVGAANGTAAAARVADDAVHLLGCGQHRQMQHDGRAETGADISRAGGQIAETLVIRERQRCFDERSYTVCGFETFLRAKAGADYLQTQMIFLADHDGHAAVLGDNQPAAVLRQLGGDEVFLDQLRGFGRTGDDLLLVKLRTDGRVFFQCSEYLVSNFTVLLFGQTERIAFNISCQAYAAGRCQTGKAAVNLKHTHFCSPSILRISSRRLAARS